MNRQEYTTGTLHASRVLKELSTFRHFAALCDGTVKLSDGTVKVSKALLAAGCPYFKILYEFEEESQGGLHRTAEPKLDITCKTFELILDFIYTGRVILDNDNIQDILQASDLLLMTDLKELCIKFLMARIDVDNCLGILQFAQQFSCPRLVHFAQDFICQHFKHRQIVRTEEFRNLSEERLKDLLSQDGLTVKSEVDILTALVVWLNSNITATPDVESLVTGCLRESNDLKYDPKFQRALQDLRASNPPWDSPGAKRVLDALNKTRRIRFIRERGMKTVLACADGGYLFALGGISTDRVLQNDVQRYDPVSNTWILMSPMPFSCCSPRVVAHAGKLYVLGGYNNEVELEISNLEEFDIYANKWRTLPSIPNVRRGAAVAVSDEKIYYIGGSPWQELPDGSPFFRVLDAVEIFCIKEEIWVAGPQLKERRSYATAISHGGNIFVIGGARPIECPSAQGQLKVTGTEALFSDSPMGWTILSKLRVPNEAKISTTALANNEHLVIVGKGDSSDIMRDNCFVMETSGWTFPPGVESILTSGTNIFFSYALLTLPTAAMQDLFSDDSE
ncbi:gigaxonin isoform X2 [Cherax quadricarinatus]|uniref:gigaxonin isoform X2 n=1 Tax=Cherax quadricarinatus TaxID=27406 RepID=UPI002378C4B3|nr:kelch-like protein 17 isoform X2 [Cherax quadricarinatus]